MTLMIGNVVNLSSIIPIIIGMIGLENSRSQVEAFNLQTQDEYI